MVYSNSILKLGYINFKSQVKIMNELKFMLKVLKSHNKDEIKIRIKYKQRQYSSFLRAIHCQLSFYHWQSKEQTKQ